MQILFGGVTNLANIPTRSHSDLQNLGANDHPQYYMTTGLFSARPAAGTANREYFATDTGKCYRDNGATWDELSTKEANLSLANFATRSFLNLSDVPASYSGQGLLGVRVNAGATALEFAAGALTTLADVTLGAPATTIDSGTITALNFMKGFLYVPSLSVNNGLRLGFNNDFGNNYNFRQSVNGAAESTQINTQCDIDSGTGTTARFAEFEIHNFLAGNTMYKFRLTQGGAAGTAPAEQRTWGCYAGAAVLTRMVFDAFGTVTLGTGSRLLILGH